MRLALGKARAARQLKGIVIGADTLVVLGTKVLGKPQWIYTGVALRNTVRGKEDVFYERSRVVFKRMTEADIEAYVRTGEYRGKAGAFGLQGKGAHLIASVSGSRSNIIGLPLEKLRVHLKKMMSTSS